MLLSMHVFIKKDFMEQEQHGFSDSTSRARGNDRLQKSAKSLLSALQFLQLMSIRQISTQKYGTGNFEPFLIKRKMRPIGGCLRNHSDQSEFVLRILKLYFCLFKRIK